MAISKKSWTGVGVEGTPGTNITTPTLYVPTKSTMKGQWHSEYLNEERGTRDANYDRVLTTREGSVDLKGPWYNDAHGYYLIGALGADTVTQPDATHVPTAYLHTIALADTPPVLGVFKSVDAAVYYAGYSAVEKISFKFDAKGKLLEFDTGLKSLYPIPATGGTFAGSFTPTYSTVKPFAGYAPTITLSGGATTDIDEATISFEQKITMWYAANGNPDYTKIYFGERKAHVDFTARFDNTTNFDKWRLGNDDSFLIVFNGAAIGAFGGTTYYQSLTLNLPKIGYDSMEHDLGKDNVLIKAKATARPQNGVALIAAAVQNTVASYAS